MEIEQLIFGLIFLRQITLVYFWRIFEKIQLKFFL